MDLQKMPSADVVEAQYSSVLEAQLIPPHVRDVLAKKETLEKKWQTVIAYYSMVGNATTTGNATFGDNDKDLIAKLKATRKRPDIRQLLQLKSRLCTANKMWMDSFVNNHGIEAIITAMNYRLSQVPLGELDAAILFELISCAKAIMNTGKTMNHFISTPGAIKALTYSLHFAWKTLAMQVLEVLSVVCDFSSQATGLVVKYLRQLSVSRREAPFAMLVTAFIHEDIEIKGAILQLLNNMLGNMNELHERLELRNELKSLKFGKLCEIAVNNLDGELEQLRESAAEMATRDSTVTRRSMPRKSTMITKVAEINVEDVPLITEDEAAELAEDGRTPISPSLGKMAGVCVAGKNLSGMASWTSNVVGLKSTKNRWYSLNGDLLQWFYVDGRDQPALGSIDVADIVDLVPYSTNEEIASLAPYSFEIVLNGRKLVLGCQLEDSKDNWLMALRVAMDRAQLRKCSYNLTSTAIVTTEFDRHAEMLRKQHTLYEAIAVEDYEQCVTKSGLNVTDVDELIRYIKLELSSCGIVDKLLELLQEIVVIPTDTAYGESYWDNLIRICREMRSLKRKSDDDNTMTIQAYKLDVTALTQLLKRKEATSGGKAVAEMNKLTMEIFTKNAEIERLQSEIKILHGTDRDSFSGAKHAATMPRPGQRNVEPRLKASERLKKMKEEHSPEKDVHRDSLRSRTSEVSVPHSPTRSRAITTDASVQTDGIVSTGPPPPPPASEPPKRPSVRFAEPPLGNPPSPSNVTRPAKPAKPQRPSSGSEPSRDDLMAMLQNKAPPPPPVAPVPEASITALQPPPAPPAAPVPSVAPPTDSGADPRANLMAALTKRAPPAQPTPAPADIDTPDENPRANLMAMLQKRAPPTEVAKDTGDARGNLMNMLANRGGAAPAAKAEGKPNMGNLLGAIAARSGGGGDVTASSAPNTNGIKRAVNSSRPIPQPPGLPADAAKFVTITAGLPLKPKAEKMDIRKPTKKVKGLFWNKVTNTASVQNGLWARVKDVDSLNFSALEEMFAQSGDGGEVARRASTVSKPKDVSLLDPKRTQNVLITLGRVRKSDEELFDIIAKMNPQELTSELTEMILTLIPTNDEIRSLNAYDGDSNKLGKADRCLLSLSRIPRLTERLQCHRIVFNWNNSADKITAHLKLLENACNEIMSPDSSEKLERILSIVLTVGNFLNAGTHRGRAEAISLDSLLKLSTVKATGNKMTLMHFIVQEILSKFKEAASFCEDWKCVNAASEISLKQIDADVKVLGVDLGLIQNEINNGIPKIDDEALAKHLLSRLNTFNVMATGKIAGLQELLSGITATVVKTLELFGESASSKDEDFSQKFFSQLSEFVQIWKRTCEEVEAMKAQEEKEKEKENKPDDKPPPPPLSSKPKPSGGIPCMLEVPTDNIFGRFRNAQEASADALVDQFKKKIQARRAEGRTAEI